MCVSVWCVRQTVPDTDLLTCWADILISFRLPVRQIKYVFRWVLVSAFAALHGGELSADNVLF